MKRRSFLIGAAVVPLVPTLALADIDQNSSPEPDSILEDTTQYFEPRLVFFLQDTMWGKEGGWRYSQRALEKRPVDNSHQVLEIYNSDGFVRWFNHELRDIMPDKKSWLS